MLDDPPLTLDFSQEAASSLIFPRPPLLSSHCASCSSFHLEYHHQPPYQTPELSPSQHLVVIHTAVPASIRSEQILNGHFCDQPASTGDVFIVPATAWYKAQWDSEGSFIVLGFEPAAFARTIYESVDPDQVELLPHLQTPDPLIHYMGLALKTELETDASGSRLYVETMANALCLHLLKHYAIQKPTIQYSGRLSQVILKQIIDYIQEHLDQDLRLADLATIAQMGPNYFATLFRRSTGFAPHQYVLHQRIERAKQLLVQGKLSIADIAYQVGFANQGHFNRQFKKIVGITPKAMQQRS
jgi:AraC family transcriptional regulator